MLNSLFRQFQNIVVIDTETTGIDPGTEEIIELGAVRITGGRSAPRTDELEALIQLSPERELPAAVTRLTGISAEMLRRDGVSKAEAGRRLAEMLDCPDPLLVAYNAQFDLGFLYYFLRSSGQEGLLKKAKMLDAMTVYKDRRDYPHKLENAVEAYGLSVNGAHRALDDARATLDLLCAMEKEREDLDRYINLFGYNPRYGVSGRRISSIRYVPQPYNAGKRIYEG